MRRVKFVEYERVAVADKWTTKETHREGLFHVFGIDFEELGDVGAGHFSTAIIELSDGTLKNVPICNVQFLDKPEEAID